MSEEKNLQTGNTDRKEARRQARIEAKRRKLAEKRAQRLGEAASAEADKATAGEDTRPSSGLPSTSSLYTEGVDRVLTRDGTGTNITVSREPEATDTQKSAEAHGQEDPEAGVQESSAAGGQKSAEKAEDGEAQNPADETAEKPEGEPADSADSSAAKSTATAGGATAGAGRTTRSFTVKTGKIPKELIDRRSSGEGGEDDPDRYGNGGADPSREGDGRNDPKGTAGRRGAIITAEKRAALKKTIERFGFKFWVSAAIALIALIGIICGALSLADYYDKKPSFIISDEGYKHAKRVKNCVPLIGIDVSQHQKGDINWEKVKSGGVDYVFIRAGYRAADNGSLHEDPKFKENAKAASKAGLMVGAYFYSQALNAEEGKEEAEFVLDVVKDSNITMPLAIDYEIYKDGRLDKRIQTGEMYAASFYHDAVLGFTNIVEAAGYESAVYASRDMLTNYMQADLIDDMATVWLARYDKKAGLDADYWFWQCTDNATSSGIEGAVDMDFWYLEPGKVYDTRAKRRKDAVSIGDCRISFTKKAYKLHHFRAEPKYYVTYEGRNMKEGRDFVSSVVHNTFEGTGYVILRGIGKYKGWIMHPFEIK